MNVRRAVFLDRDGVINKLIKKGEAYYSPHRTGELELYPGVRRSLEILKCLKFVIVVFTNQPDIKRGMMILEDLQAMHETIKNELPIDDIFVCLHDDSDLCACRKPEPGLLLEAASKWNIDLGKSFVIGDRWRDIEAGSRAGCGTLLIGDSKDQERPCRPDHTAGDLASAVRIIAAMGK
jgi:D-glycero-D-manno-heptose 1,7-bisphosphate phosphatase